jgi:hypothetical protein
MQASRTVCQQSMGCRQAFTVLFSCSYVPAAPLLLEARQATDGLLELTVGGF